MLDDVLSRISTYTPPEMLPADTICRRLRIPDDPTIVAAINDVLAYLTLEGTWETDEGEDYAIRALMSEMLLTQDNCPQETVSTMIGTILPYITAVPPENALPCDGSQYLRVEYPDLYAMLNTAFIVDADHFKTPDLRGRTIIGAGIGTGLTPRSVGALVGAEQHQLVVQEIPDHTHYLLAQTAGGTSMANTYTRGTHLAQPQPATSVGNSAPHNNMQPSLALNYCVIAL